MSQTIRYERIAVLYRIAILINTVGTTLISSVLVVFLGNFKELGTESAGIIIGLTPILVLPFTFLWGNLIDRTKKIIKFLTILQLCNAVLTFSMIFANSFGMLFLITIIKNIIMLPVYSLGDEYLMFLVNKGNLSFGKIRLFGTLGYALAGLVGPVISLLAGVKGGIMFGSLLIFISVFIYRKMPEIVLEEIGIKEVASKEKKNILKNTFALFKNFQFVSVLIIASSILGVAGAASSYGNQVVLLGLNCPDAVIAALPFCLVFLEIIVLRAMDIIDFGGKEYKFYLVAVILCIVRWGVMAMTGSYMAVVATSALHGVTSGIMMPIQNKVVGSSVKDNQRSTAYLLVAVTSFTIVPSVVNLITSKLSGMFEVGMFGIVYLMFTLPSLFLIVRKIKKDKAIACCKDD